MHWNAVPWYLGVRGKIAAAKAQDIEHGREWLLRLVDLPPDLRVVLCHGNAARDAVAPGRKKNEARGLSAQCSAPEPEALQRYPGRG